MEEKLKKIILIVVGVFILFILFLFMRSSFKSRITIVKLETEIVNKEDLSIYLLRRIYKLYPSKLEERYGITEVKEDIIPTLDMIAKKRGALSKGAEVDYDKVYQIILRDIKEGLLGSLTLDRMDQITI